MTNKKDTSPRILLADIETSPIISYTWGIFDQQVSLNQIKQDWHLLSFSAKWLGSSKIIYKDQRNKKDITDDTDLLKEIWKLLDEADIVITQNGKKFDIKKLNARFIIKGFQPPSSFKQIDTLVLAKKYFGFTSNKLEYLSNTLNKKYKKQTKRHFAGFDLWKECLKGNIKAWKEMEKYNKYDVLSLEEVYNKLIPWDNSINFNIYKSDPTDIQCKCGNRSFVRNGFAYTAKGKFQRYRCEKCGSETRDTQNLLSKEEMKNIRVGTKR